MGEPPQMRAGPDRIDRRTVLAAAASLVGAGTAGCLGDNEDTATDASPTATSETEVTQTATPAAPATPAATPEPDRTQTAAIDFEHPDTVGRDEPFDLFVRGLPADTTADITLNGQPDSSPTATATVETGDGSINLAAAPVVGGDVPTDFGAPTTVALLQFGALDGRYSFEREKQLTYSVSVAGNTLGETEVTMIYEFGESTELPGDLVGVLHEPADVSAGPGVVVLHGSGGEPLIRTARQLSQNGFAALALHYFSGDGLPSDLVEVSVEYVNRAAEWLRGRDSVTGDQVGLLGYSRGGELALLAASQFDISGPVVSMLGSGLVWSGGDRVDAFPGTSSWSLDGEPVPHVPLSREEWQSNSYTEDQSAFFDDSLERVSDERIEDATIPVENIDGPLLLVSGGDDSIWPSERLQDIAAHRIENHGRSDYEHVVYDRAGHGILPPYYPVNILRTDWYGGSGVGNAFASHDHWSRVLDTLSTLDE